MEVFLLLKKNQILNLIVDNFTAGPCNLQPNFNANKKPADHWNKWVHYLEVLLSQDLKFKYFITYFKYFFPVE